MVRAAVTTTVAPAMATRSSISEKPRSSPSGGMWGTGLMGIHPFWMRRIRRFLLWLLRFRVFRGRFFWWLLRPFWRSRLLLLFWRRQPWLLLLFSWWRWSLLLLFCGSL